MSSIFKRSHKTTCHFLPNFLTKKNLTRGNAALIRSRHAGHRVAPRHGQSGPEWGHGAHRRQRRTYRTFSHFIPHFSLLCCSFCRCTFFRGGSPRERPSKQIGRVMFLFLSLMLLLFCSRVRAHRNHRLVLTIKLSCSLFSNALS